MTAISSGMSKIRSLTGADWRGSPLTELCTCSAVTSAISSADDRVGAHRAVRVQRLADGPLLVPGLQVAGGDVVDDGVAPDVAKASLRRDAAPPRPMITPELGLVVQLGGHAVVRVDVVERAGHRRGGLGEHHRVLGQGLGAVGLVVAGAAELGHVLAVVLAHAKRSPAGTGIGASSRTPSSVRPVPRRGLPGEHRAPARGQPSISPGLRYRRGSRCGTRPAPTLRRLVHHADRCADPVRP
jgi:hypothetical protein